MSFESVRGMVYFAVKLSGANTPDLFPIPKQRISVLSMSSRAVSMSFVRV